MATTTRPARTARTATEPRPHAPHGAAALAGLLAGALTVGVAELLAAGLAATRLERGSASPVIAVGDAVVDRTPSWLKDIAVRTLGEHDKPVLLASVGVVLAGLAVGAGLLAGRRMRAGQAVVVLLGLVATVAVLTRPSASLVDVVPTVVGTALGLVALDRLLGRPRSAEPGGWSRRTFLRGVGAVGATAATAGAGSRVVARGASGVAESRAAVRLPEPVERVSVPAGAQLDVEGITPFLTASRDFYRVDTALSLPQIPTEDWSLRVHGLVGRELTLGYDELLRRPLVERAITLTCVSNEVGGRLAGNAVWLGYPVADLLRDLDVDPAADMVLSTSRDGMTISTPLENLTRDRDALLAVAMNGDPLPVEHGFPVRMVVPGLYGYISATKWVTDLNVTRFDRDEAYWTPRGYAPRAPVKISSRIDVPRSFAKLRAGRNVVAGVAWAQTRGVRAVQVRVDGGRWQDAELAEAPGPDTWVQWIHPWDASAGSHTIECRVIDGTGSVQEQRRTSIRPDGTTGLDSKFVTVL